jgi:hypothetical protein
MAQLIHALFLVLVCISCLSAQSQTSLPDGLHYIDTSFENASPMNWEVDQDGTIQCYMIYDHERNSPNRAAGHWLFRVEGRKGVSFRFVINNLNNVWNGRPSTVAKEETISFKSSDQKNWTAFETELLEGNRLAFELTMDSETMYIARVEPYRVSDLDHLLEKIQSWDQGTITAIGKTVQGRDLEIIDIGNAQAPYRIFIRARAHPWEPGGNWVVQGMIHELMHNPDKAQKYLKRFSLHVLPMANKDGVANGWTRFNAHGMDLNRKWDRPASQLLCPENFYLEQWFMAKIAQDEKPDLAIDFHNDQGGRLHIARPHIDLEKYLNSMKRFENLLYQHTWFTEGATGGNFRNPGSIGEGLLERFGITAFVYELNSNRIAGKDDYAYAKYWENLGAELLDVFYEYVK